MKTVSNSLNDDAAPIEVINIRNNIGLVSESLNLNQYIEIVQNVLSEQIITKTFLFLERSSKWGDGQL
jgi:ABC-type phosphate/phosphonate transport system ATPase subunit